MNRCFCWAMLIAAGMVLGSAFSSYERTPAVMAAREASDDEANVAGQLKDIKTQVKEINTLLQSGTLRVVVVINPGR